MSKLLLPHHPGVSPTHHETSEAPHWVAAQSACRRWFRFAYVAGRDDRERLPHHARDAEAALALEPALRARGYTYAGTIFNYPPTKEQQDEPDPPDAGDEIDESFLSPGDLLVLTTRPPMDDLVDGVRGSIRPSGTKFEAKVFGCIRRHIVHCSRARVRVADVHTRASAEIARLANIQFRQKGGAGIDAVLGRDSRRWQRGFGAAPATVAYLIHDPQAWEGGPGVLASFGMSGTDTLAWNTVLATKYPKLVASTPFLMAEFSAADRPRQPHTLDHVHGWKFRLVSAQRLAAG